VLLNLVLSITFWSGTAHKDDTFCRTNFKQIILNRSVRASEKIHRSPSTFVRKRSSGVRIVQRK